MLDLFLEFLTIFLRNWNPSLALPNFYLPYGLQDFFSTIIELFFFRNIICDEELKTNYTMCPRCDKKCDYFPLHETCGYAKVM